MLNVERQTFSRKSETFHLHQNLKSCFLRKLFKIHVSSRNVKSLNNRQFIRANLFSLFGLLQSAGGGEEGKQRGMFSELVSEGAMIARNDTACAGPREILIYCT